MWILHGFVAPEGPFEALGPSAAGALAALPTLCPGARPQALQAGPLVAVASDLSVAPEALDFAVADSDAAARLAAQHARLLCALVETQDVLPARFGGALPADDDFSARLTREATALAPRFEALRGAAEYALRVLDAGGAQTTGRPVATPAASEAQGGRAYLARRLQARRARATRGDLRAAALARIEKDAALLSRAVVRRQTAPGPGRRRLLDLALLVSRTQVAALGALAADAEAELTPAGLTLEIVGPWPPFHFVDPANEVAA